MASARIKTKKEEFILGKREKFGKADLVILIVLTAFMLSILIPFFNVVAVSFTTIVHRFLYRS